MLAERRSCQREYQRRQTRSYRFLRSSGVAHREPTKFRLRGGAADETRIARREKPRDRWLSHSRLRFELGKPRQPRRQRLKRKFHRLSSRRSLEISFQEPVSPPSGGPDPPAQQRGETDFDPLRRSNPRRANTKASRLDSTCEWSSLSLESIFRD